MFVMAAALIKHSSTPANFVPGRGFDLLPHCQYSGQIWIYCSKKGRLREVPLPPALSPLFCLRKLIKDQSHPQHSCSVVSGPASATSALQTLRVMAAAARDVKSCEPTSTSLCQQKHLRQTSLTARSMYLLG